MSDYLSEEEQIERLRGWWQSNGAWLVGGVVIVAVVALGWRWYGDRQAANAAEFSDLYAAYTDAADDAARESALGALLAASSGSAYAGLAQMNAAQRAVADEKPEQAQVLLEAVVKESGDALIQDLARLRLASVLQQLDQSEAALKTLGEVRSSGFRALALERKGDVLAVRGDRTAAHEAYSAAMAELEEGDQRPILEMKLAHAAGSVNAAIGAEAPVEETEASAAVDQPQPEPDADASADAEESAETAEVEAGES